MIAAALVLMQLGVMAGSTWVTQPIGTDTHLHMVRAINSSVAWAAGENGTWARTADGGVTWYANPVYTCTSCPISAMVAHDAESAVLASGGQPARIYVTGDGGRSWSLQFESGEHEMRIAAMAFFDVHRGFAISDPVAGRYVLLTTEDGGATWSEAGRDVLPHAAEGERISVVSGSGAVAVSPSRALVATTGGGTGRLFLTEDGGKSWTAVATRLTGLNGLAFASEKVGIAVGSGRGRASAVKTTDGGRTWSEPFVIGLPGTKEGIAYVPGTNGRSLVVVGAAGSALSTDGGTSWKIMDRTGAHAVSFAGVIDSGWKVGDAGLIRKLLRGMSARSRITEAAQSPSVVAPELGVARPATSAPATSASPASRPAKKVTKLEN